MKATYEDLWTAPSTVRAITFLVALPVVTRCPSPAESMLCDFGIVVPANPDIDQLMSSANNYVPDGPGKASLLDTIAEYTNRYSAERLFDTDDWSVWRNADGAAFCDLAMMYFAHLNRELFSKALGDSGEATKRFADEAAIITRSFSARWFNACARFQVPEQGSINWYLGHCLGKVDLELSRELSDWVEPTGNPWKRSRAKTQDPLKV